jgi:hypothetical protein
MPLGHGTVPKDAKFASIGSHIIGTSMYLQDSGDSVTVTFDIQTEKLVRSKGLGGMCYDAAIPIGDSLYVLESFLFPSSTPVSCPLSI